MAARHDAKNSVAHSESCNASYRIFHDTIYNVAPFEVDLLISFVHLASDIAFHVLIMFTTKRSTEFDPLVIKNS